MGTHPTRTPTATAATRPRPERPQPLTARAAQFPPETPSRGFAATACWGNRLPGCSPGGGSGGPFRCRGLGKRSEQGLGGSEQTKPGGTLPSTMSRNDRSVISEGQPHQPHRRRAGNSRGLGRCSWLGRSRTTLETCPGAVGCTGRLCGFSHGSLSTDRSRLRSEGLSFYSRGGAAR